MSASDPAAFAAHTPASESQQDITKAELRAFKERDNVTNIWHLAIVYIVIGLTAAIAIWTCEAYLAGQIGIGWAALVTILAIFSMGASQHQFGGVIHEATHFVLFKNRFVNELASDWFAGFPIYTSTQAYRLSHFAHHQFVNDPKRDPILTTADDGGHWLDFPADHTALIKGVMRLFWPLNLIRYMIARAKHSAVPQADNPFADSEHEESAWPVRAGILFALGVPFIVAHFAISGQFALAGGILLASWLALMLYYALIPKHHFPRSHIRPVISDRATIMMRMSYLAIIYGSLTYIQFLTGRPAWGYFALFWVLPLVSTFAVFMIFREWVQHGNADRGRLTNSRVFLVDPVSRYAVFPFGMDYHQPHHMYVSVPHYKLKGLHEFMLRTDPAYANECSVVKGWFGKEQNGMPSIVEVLGPKYARSGDDIHVNEDTIAEADIANREAIDEHVRQSRNLR